MYNLKNDFIIQWVLNFIYVSLTQSIYFSDTDVEKFSLTANLKPVGNAWL